MKFTKRITSLLLIFVFALTSIGVVPTYAAFSDVDETNPYFEAISALVNDGTINGYEDGTFKPDNTITRAEFCKLLSVASAPTAYNFSSTTTTFPDIPDMNADHGWAVPYIAYAVSTKAINGYTDGTFKAGNTVTYAEAVKMIVCTLGYGPVVDMTLGTWYQGYLNIANQIGLSKGAIIPADTPAPRGIIAQLIFNMLDAPMLVQTGVDASGNPTYGTGESLEQEVNQVEIKKGVVLGVTDYSLDGSPVGRNSVLIDGTVYELASNLSVDGVKSYIGETVEYSYTNNHNGTKINKIVRVSGYNNEITLEPWQIKNVQPGYVEYYADERAEARDDSKKITFATPFYVIYNGMPVKMSDITSAFITTNLNVETGSLKLISNDGIDTTAELARVESYKTYYIENAPAINDNKVVLTDKNGVTPGSIEIDAYDAEGNIKKITSKGGSEGTASLNGITSKTVVSVAQPIGTDLSGTKVKISSASETGTIIEIDTSNYDVIKIGTKSYELSPYYRTLMNNNEAYKLEKGTTATFRLDFLGRIAYMEKTAEAIPYGLLIAYETEGRTTKLVIKENSSKAPEHYVIANNNTDTITVDGTKMIASEAIAHLKTTAAESLKSVNSAGAPLAETLMIQPVRYKYSKSLEKLTEIETLSSGEYAKGRKLKYDSSGDMFTGYTRIRKSSSTIIFEVPSNPLDETKYKNSSSFIKNDYYILEGYEMDGTAAKLIVCYKAAGESSGAKVVATTPVYMVEAIGSTSDKNGDVVPTLTYKSSASGASKTLSAQYDDALMDKFTDLELGDIVKFVTDDADGAICDLELIYDRSANKLITNDGYTGNDNRIVTTTADNNFIALMGTLDDIGEKNIYVIPQFYTEGHDLTEEFESFVCNSSVEFFKLNTGLTNPAFELATRPGSDSVYALADTVAKKLAVPQVIVFAVDHSVSKVYIIK